MLTFQITKKAYVRALFKTVTLDHGLVSAYRADLDQQQQRQQGRGGEIPRATLEALTSGEHEPVTTTAQQSQSSPGVLGPGGTEAAAAGGGATPAPASAAVHESSGEEDLLAREAALRDEFLFQVRWR